MVGGEAGQTGQTGHKENPLLGRMARVSYFEELKLNEKEPVRKRLGEWAFPWPEQQVQRP